MSSHEILMRGPFERSQVRVQYRPGMRMPVDPTASRAIEREWQARRRQAAQTGFPLYSGRLFRVEGYGQGGAGSLVLTLGDTTYREYVGTRVAAFFAARRRDELANPLAVCAAVVTADGGIVLARRQRVDVGEGQYHVIGGFMERGKDGDPFAAMARELHEELGLAVPPGHFLCLGLVYDLVQPHYELCFTTRLAMPFEELARLRPLEQEASRLDRLPDTPESLHAFLAAHQGKMSPTGEGCLTLYAGWREQLT